MKHIWRVCQRTLEKMYLDEMDKQKKADSIVYRRPSTMIEKQQALAERLADCKSHPQ